MALATLSQRLNPRPFHGSSAGVGFAADDCPVQNSGVVVERKAPAVRLKVGLGMSAPGFRCSDDGFAVAREIHLRLLEKQLSTHSSGLKWKKPLHSL